MPTIKVNWNLRTYNTTVNSNTLISEIVLNSIKYFKLNGKPELYALKTKHTILNNSLSLRFTNLPQGAFLDLIYQGDQLVDNNNDINNDKIKLRLTFVNSDDINGNLFGEYKPLTKIIELIENAGVDLNNIFNENSILKIQTITKVIEIEKNANLTTLADLGIIKGNHAIRVIIEKSSKKVSY